MNFKTIRDEIIADVESHEEWREEVSRGKMFGFLIAEGGRVLKAYSGQICGRSDWEGYVPAIYDYLQPDGYFKTHEAEISELNRRIREAEAQLPKGKRTREVEEMKHERKERSQALQRWLFSQFTVTPPLPSPTGREILSIFTEYAQRTGSKQVVPPSGTGECCTPKLLNYANQHGLKPLAVAEFWYGESPKGVIRHHGQFYEPCQAKCMPLLWYMMPEDCVVYPFRPLPPPSPAERELEVLWEDDYYLAINKPSGLLSVPGKRNLPNAEEMVKSQRSKVKGLRVKACHRLDMDTSGILLFAKTEDAFVAMQRLFAEHDKVRKEYEAIVAPLKSPQLGGEPSCSKGVISLPLSADFEHRPMQRVDYENGKEAVTEYEFIDGNRVRLFPLTGRTHQLRIHCAHPDGLNSPIVGDPLYGNTHAERMMLHATRLTFEHPFTHETIKIECPTPF
ncbi:MAG: hypothetical protein IKO82_05845 [Prevotella sp.]|nr:hypothetical protein [Prevotella sp.]